MTEAPPTVRDPNRAVHRLDGLDRPRAEELLAPCCGSRRFRENLLGARPWHTIGGMLEAVDEAFSGLRERDWLEAFAAHPRIGDRRALRSRYGDRAGAWAEGEQSGVDGVSEQVLERLAEGNRRYEARFGHVFLICASGLAATEMLAALERRLDNDPATELELASAEERRIVRGRLEKLLQGPGSEESP